MRRPEHCRDLWYVAMASRDLRAGRLVGKTILGEPVVFGRKAAGEPFALRDRCPHRGMPLRHGTQTNGHVECCYHGWQFGVDDGRCSLIPALTERDEVRVERIGVPVYPCREVGGQVWIFVPSDARRGADRELPPVPTEAALGPLLPRAAASRVFPCHADWAVIGLTDPAHVTFVHRSWWWRRKREMRLKEKPFSPVPLGYRMGPHQMAHRPLPYRLLGDTITVEITFVLPGVRIEVIRGEKHHAVSITSVTPTTENECEMFHAVYTTRGGIWWLTPFGKRLIRTFLEQDRDFVVKQVPGLAGDESLVLPADADQEARWYFALKREHLDASAQGREFKNPVEATTLRWKS